MSYMNPPMPSMPTRGGKGMPTMIPPMGTQVGPPPTSPPKNFHQLSPDEQQALLDEGWQPLEDGSMVHPDGRTRPAYDSPNDFSSGGYGSAPSGPPGTTPPGAPPPPMGSDLASGDALPSTPFDAPQFDRYFNTANAGFPGTPGGVGGGPLDTGGPLGAGPKSPLGEPAGKPFDVPDVTPPLVINNGGGPTGMGADKTKPTGQYGGRIGRKMAARGSTGGRRR